MFKKAVAAAVAASVASPVCRREPFLPAWVFVCTSVPIRAQGDSSEFPSGALSLVSSDGPPSFTGCRSWCEPLKVCSLGFGRHRAMTAEKGNYVKHKKSAVVVAGAIMALGMGAPAFADAGAEGSAVGSPGVLSGNVIQVPIHVPVNVCGNTVDVIALLNPAFGNSCANG